MSGFVVLDGAGEFLAWSACVVSAVRRSREMPRAQRVERCSDNALIAYAPRGKRWLDSWADSLADAQVAA